MTSTPSKATAGHTPGPWMAASRPSSVVGLPVVSQTGRSIASVTYFNLGEHFDKHDQESRANARLIAAAPDLLAAAVLLETAEEAHANCDECGGEEIPELCPKCFPLFDDARVKRRAAISRATGGA